MLKKVLHVVTTVLRDGKVLMSFHCTHKSSTDRDNQQYRYYTKHGHNIIS